MQAKDFGVSKELNRELNQHKQINRPMRKNAIRNKYYLRKANKYTRENFAMQIN